MSSVSHFFTQVFVYYKYLAMASVWADRSLYIAITGIIGLLQVGSVISFFIKFYRFDKGSLRKISNILHNSTVSWVYFLLTPHICELFMSEYSCTWDRAELNLTNHPSEKCFSSLNILIKLLFLIFLGCHLFCVFTSIWFTTKKIPTYSTIGVRRSFSIELNFIICNLLLEVIRVMLNKRMLLTYGVLLVGMSLLLLYTSSNYYIIPNQIERKNFTVCFSVNLWMGICLLIAIVYGESSPSYILDIFMITTPCIAFLAIFKIEDSQKKLMCVDFPSINSEKEVEALLENIQFLFLSREYNQESSTELHGFIGYHQRGCSTEGCPIQTSNLYLGDGISKTNRYFEVVEQAFPQLLSNMYKDSIMRFPNSVRLRVSYGLFLSELMDSRSHGIEVVRAASNVSKSNEDDFLIEYTLQNFNNCKDELEDDNERASIEALKQKLSTDRFVKTLENSMEITAASFFELWRSNQSDTADMNKVIFGIERIAKHIKAIDKQVKAYYDRLITLPDILKKYALFLLYVQNEEKRGFHMLEKAQAVQSQYIRQNYSLPSIEIGLDLSIDPTPTIQLLITEVGNYISI